MGHVKRLLASTVIPPLVPEVAKKTKATTHGLKAADLLHAVKTSETASELKHYFTTGVLRAALVELNADIESNYSVRVLGTAAEDGHDVEVTYVNARVWYSGTAGQNVAIEVFNQARDGCVQKQPSPSRTAISFAIAIATHTESETELPLPP